MNVELHAVLHCAESVAAIWMANAFGSGVLALWEEHGFALRLFLASSVIQWPLLLILRCFCSHQLPSHDFVAVRDCLSEAESICDSCRLLGLMPPWIQCISTVPVPMRFICLKDVGIHWQGVTSFLPFFLMVECRFCSVGRLAYVFKVNNYINQHFS